MTRTWLLRPSRLRRARPKKLYSFSAIEFLYPWDFFLVFVHLAHDFGRRPFLEFPWFKRTSESGRRERTTILLKRELIAHSVEVTKQTHEVSHKGAQEMKLKMLYTTDLRSMIHTFVISVQVHKIGSMQGNLHEWCDLTTSHKSPQSFSLFLALTFYFNGQTLCDWNGLKTSSRAESRNSLPQVTSELQY